MTKLYSLTPEPGGEIGPRSIVGNRDEVSRGLAFPRFDLLEYVFDCWLGDDLVGTAGNTIVTVDLANRIVAAEAFTGVDFGRVIVSVDPHWRDFSPTLAVPAWRRLMPAGYVTIEKHGASRWSGDDVCISTGSYQGLFVSPRFWEFLGRNARVSRCRHDIVDIVDAQRKD